APLTDGIFSSAIKMYGLFNPNIRICLFPETASEKFTSIDGLVSKASDRLQQAALSNSELEILIILAEEVLILERLCLLRSITRVSSIESGYKTISRNTFSVTLIVSVLIPTKEITRF